MLVCLSFLLSLLGTKAYRRYALAKNILDIPNERSAHQLPIPRGGGIVFVVIFLSAGLSQQSLSMSLLSICLTVALLGYLDDRYALSAWVRLACQMMLAMSAVTSLDGLPEIHIGSLMFLSQTWVGMLAAIYLVWMLNLYNFMDGINGIAGLEAISVALGMAGVYWVLDLQGVDLLLSLAVVVAGFLVWNFPKAQVFMGDAGSSFLGFVFGLCSLHVGCTHPALFWSWLIVLGIFVVDATLTLFLRMLKGEPLHVAHSEHAYQIASRHFQSHSIVSLAVLIFNIVWLWPWAVVVGLGDIPGLTGLLIAYGPIVIGVCFIKVAYPRSLIFP